MRKSFPLIGALTFFCALTSCSNVVQNHETPFQEEVEPEYVDYINLHELVPIEVKSGSENYNLLSLNAGLEKDGDLHELALYKDVNKREYINYPEGVSLHAGNEAYVTYDISDMQASRFVGYFGVNVNHKDRNGQARLKIEADNNSIYESSYVTQNDNALLVDVTIPANTKILKFNFIDENNRSASHAILANTKLYLNYMNIEHLDMVDRISDSRGVFINSTYSGHLQLHALYKGQYDNQNYYPQTIDFKHGVGAHLRDGSVEGYTLFGFDIENLHAKRFTAFYGNNADQDTDSNPEMNFDLIFVNKNGEESVKHLNKKDLQNPSITIGGTIDVKIPEDIKYLKLKAIGVNTDSSCHPVLISPCLYGGDFSLPYRMNLNTKNAHYLAIGEHMDYSLTYTDLKGIVHELDKSLVHVSSSSGSIAIVGGDIIGCIDGEADINFTYKGLTKTLHLSVYNNDNAMHSSISSPNGNITLYIDSINSTKTLYSIKYNDEYVVKASDLGFQCTGLDLYESLIFVMKSDIKHVEENYKMISGKASIYYTNYNTQTFYFKNSNDQYLKIEVIASNEGCAFRYGFSSKSGNFKLANSERTKINLDSNDTLHFQRLSGNGKYQGSHENIYVTTKNPAIEEIWEEHASEGVYKNGMVMPILVKTPKNTSMLISEANLDGTYPGSMINRVADNFNDACYKINVVPQQYHSYSAKTTEIETDNFNSPWRVFVIGSEKTLMENTLIDALARKQDDTIDFSYVKPGITSWSWMSGVNASRKNPEKYPSPFEYQAVPDMMKKQIDLAAEMGWQYYILDEGWMIREKDPSKMPVPEWSKDHLPGGGFPIGIYDFMPEVVRYANSKGVGLIGWVHVSQFNNPENDYAQMKKLLDDLSNLGLKGIKADFFDSESKFTIELYNRLYEELMKRKMIGNAHGANKPTGERRYYQNMVNREGIWGEEANHTLMEQVNLQIYCRSSTGPTDFTPYIYPANKSDTTMAAQMAMPVLFESGMTCFASTVEEFRALNSDIKDYYYAYPSAWDETYFLNGSTHQDLSLARRSRDGRYYVGGITTRAKKETIKFDFLDPNYKYEARIYTNRGSSNSRNAVNYQKVEVTSASSIDIDMIHNGGFAIKLTPTKKIELKNPQLAFLN